MRFKAILLTLITSLTACLNVNADDSGWARKTVGVTTGYVTKNHSASAGVRLSYAFSRHFVLSPSIDYVFHHNNTDAFLFNLDYYGPWRLDALGKWHVYHILGVNYASWNKSTPQTDADNSGEGGVKDVTTRQGHLGLDFGLGFAYDVSSSMRLTAQGKINWVKHDSTGLITLGISYVF